MFYIMVSKRNLKKKSTRKLTRLGGAHPDPPGTRYDNKGRRLAPPPPPPLTPPVLRRQNAIVHDLSLQPDAPSPSGSDMSLSSISSASSSYTPAARRLFLDNEGQGLRRKKSRKNRKMRKSRKIRKSRKSRKSRKIRKSRRR